MYKFLRTAIAIVAGMFAVSQPAVAASPAAKEQALIIYLRLSNDEFGAEGESFALYDVEDAVEKAVTKFGALDGHEIGGGYFTIYLYGRDASTMLTAAAPVLTGQMIRAGSYAIARSGPPGAPEKRVDLPVAPPH